MCPTASQQYIELCQIQEDHTVRLPEGWRDRAAERGSSCFLGPPHCMRHITCCSSAAIPALVIHICHNPARMQLVTHDHSYQRFHMCIGYVAAADIYSGEAAHLTTASLLARDVSTCPPPTPTVPHSPQHRVCPSQISQILLGTYPWSISAGSLPLVAD